MINVSGLVGLEQRIADGSGNNQHDPTLGTAGSQLINLAPRKYVDGVGQPHEYANARHISNTVVAQDGAVPNADGVSDLFTFFGQFIDHDIDITHAGSGGAMSTTVPMGDGTFAEGSLLHLSRSNTMDGTGTTGAREYANEITSFVDGSNIYGSSATVAGILRGSDGNGGKSAYLMTGTNGGLPTLAEVAGANPGADLSGILDNPLGSDSVFVAGDIRANENVALTSMHTVWVNEHNYQVNKLRGDHRNLSEDELFDAARVIVEAEYHNVVFNEYLPQLLGASNIPEYQGYDSNVDPSIAIEFSTAAFRLGHSQLSSTLQRLNADGSESDAGHLNLFGAFFNPAELQNEEDLSTLIRGLSDGQGQQVDTMIVDDVRNMLFGEGGPGMDLATLNIMRGRDHGIATLNEMREALGLDVYTNYSQLTSDPVLADALASVYASIDDVELWVGGLAEDKVSGSQLGAVFHTIVLDQFMRLRDGDRFYHEERLQDFPELLAEIANVSLSDILLRNTNIDYLQDDVFVAHNRIGGTNGHDHIVGSDGHDLLYGGAVMMIYMAVQVMMRSMVARGMMSLMEKVART